MAATRVSAFGARPRKRLSWRPTSGPSSRTRVATSFTRPFAKSRTCSAPGLCSSSLIWSVTTRSGLITKSIGMCSLLNRLERAWNESSRMRAIFRSVWNIV